ncbi:hypothetical protein FVR03_13195 [Pontibacter qinzhouensis]|uniref:O-antigen ligase-related domain-containing protein n=1 Tax=Pontibacter qinzhouensis TaxID=2603253 RepID=A0A5C8K732_9BACT|nr:O-antigen ligase family protein [Pontibacter qinzhouensis]TXK44905.1 hypothetical protein FVR03_13195 [Pontibacter qinzhouensis]
MLKKLIGLFLIFSPFTSYFALSGWLRLPVMLLLITISAFLIKLIFKPKIKIKALKIKDYDILLIVFLGIVWVSFITGFANKRSFNHSLAYTFAIGAYYFILRIIVHYEKLDAGFIMKMFAISAVVCSCIITLDFILINVFKIGIRGYFINLDNGSANMLYYIRGRAWAVGGVAEEPGSMALLMNIICPVGILYYKLRENQFMQYFLTILYLFSMIFLFSAAGMLILILVYGFIFSCTFLLSKRITIKKSNILAIFLLIGISALLVVKYYAVLEKPLNELSDKVLFKNNSYSASIRLHTWVTAFKDWFMNPFLGNGPGYGVEKYTLGYHSIYLTILADLGIFAIIAFVSFLIKFGGNLFWLNPQIRTYFMLPFLSTLVHLAIVGDFYHAPFWILLILIQLIQKDEYIRNFTS